MAASKKTESIAGVYVRPSSRGAAHVKLEPAGQNAIRQISEEGAISFLAYSDTRRSNPEARAENFRKEFASVYEVADTTTNTQLIEETKELLKDIQGYVVAHLLIGASMINPDPVRRRFERLQTIAPKTAEKMGAMFSDSELDSSLRDMGRSLIPK